jgi:membrane protease YdiL (CAAX protease family)
VSPQRLLSVALLTQGGLIALSWWCARIFDLPPQWGQPVRDAWIGLVAAIALGVVNYLLLTRAPSNWLVDGVRTTYHDVIVPLFGRLTLVGSLVLGAAAGIGEEWLFRGILQPMVGLAASSLLFGAAHIGGLRMLPFGVWATGMGMAMGTLAMLTGGLTAPMVAHGVYDMLALEYIRRGAHDE